MKPLPPSRSRGDWLGVAWPAVAYTAAGWLIGEALKRLGISGETARLARALALLALAGAWYARASGRPPAVARPGAAWLRGAAAGVVLGSVTLLIAGGVRQPDASAGGRACRLISLCVAGPIAEELIYRGLTLRRGLRLMSAPGAIALSAALFAAGHGFSARAALSLAAGAVFGAALCREGTLAAPIAAHALANAVLLAAPGLPAWLPVAASAGGVACLALLNNSRNNL